MAGQNLALNQEKENRYRYNGKEFHSELDLGWYDYGFRWYDPVINRFFSVDPLAEEFPELTTYQYASNTPIWAIDLDGLEALKVTGDPEALEKFARRVEESSGGFRKVNINSESGLVSLSKTDKEGKPTDRQQNFISTMEGITIEGSEEFEVGIVESSEDILVGEFSDETIDIDDIEKFGDSEFVSAGGTLAHELVEQKAKQVDGTPKSKAHQIGIDAENKINGVERKVGNLSSTKIENFGVPGLPTTGNIDFRVKKQDGDKIFPIVKKVSVLIEKGNVSKVKVSDLK